MDRHNLHTCIYFINATQLKQHFIHHLFWSLIWNLHCKTFFSIFNKVLFSYSTRCIHTDIYFLKTCDDHAHRLLVSTSFNLLHTHQYTHKCSVFHIQICCSSLTWHTTSTKRLLSNHRTCRFVIDVKVTSCLFQFFQCILQKVSVNHNEGIITVQ